MILRTKLLINSALFFKYDNNNRGNVSFCPTVSPKPKDVQFSLICDKEKQQILSCEKLDPDSLVFILCFCLKNDWNDLWIIKIDSDYFAVDQLIDW